MIKDLNFQEHGTRATRNVIHKFEIELGLKMPTAFIEFCLAYNGGFPSEENKFYPVPESFSEFHTEYQTSGTTPGVAVDILFGITDNPIACSLASSFFSLNKASSIGLFPISEDLLGNQVVLRNDDLNGQVYFRDHELWESPGVPMLFSIADNIEFFYNSLTADLNYYD